MGLVRKIRPATIGAMLVSVPVVAEPSPALVVVQLADPDPNYVAPPDTKGGHRHKAAEEDSLDQAMEQFGQALGQAIQLQQQMMLQRCKASEGAAGTSQGRMAWEAACKYTRR